MADSKGIVALLRGWKAGADFSPICSRSIYERQFTPSISASTRSPAGNSPWRKPGPMAEGVRGASLGTSGRVCIRFAQAIGRNPFVIIVPCHRVLEAGGYADKISPAMAGVYLQAPAAVSIDGAGNPSSKNPVRRCCFRFAPAAPARPKFSGMAKNKPFCKGRSISGKSTSRCRRGAGRHAVSWSSYGLSLRSPMLSKGQLRMPNAKSAGRTFETGGGDRSLVGPSRRTSMSAPTITSAATSACRSFLSP